MKTMMAALLALAAPAVAQVPAMTPAQVIAAATTGETAATVEMMVGSTGAAGFQVYLNSEADYRSPTNLTIELFPGARAKLVTRIGGEPQDLLTGKRMRVTGTAKRITIPRRDGTSTSQTRIEVHQAEQIAIVD